MGMDSAGHEGIDPRGEERQSPDQKTDVLVPDNSTVWLSGDEVPPSVQERIAAQKATQRQAAARDLVEAVPDPTPAAAPAPTETSPWAASDAAFAEDRTTYAQEFVERGRGPVGRFINKAKLWLNDGEPPKDSGLRK